MLDHTEVGDYSMRIEGMYPPPILGVSTLNPRHRIEGQAGEQVNFRSDPIKRLTRRPPLRYDNDSLLIANQNADVMFYHSYERDGDTYRIIVNKVNGNVFTFKNNERVSSTGNLAGYVGENLIAQTIDHDTYIVNTDKVTKMKDGTDNLLIKKVSHINVTSALAYGETVIVNITRSNGDRHVISYSVPSLIESGNPEDPPDYDRADRARATRQVALMLAAKINGGGTHTVKVPNPDYPEVPTADAEWRDKCMEYNASGSNPNYTPTASVCKPYVSYYSGISGVTAAALGSSVAIWEDDGEEWLDVEIETGQGDRSCVAVNQVIENVDGLPLFAVVGTRITVRPNPTSEKGTYYLQAERTADSPSGELLEEVVWAETRHPYELNAFDETTMPHRIRFNGSTFSAGTVPWKDRQAGDNNSNPRPEFIENTIEDIGYFQKRLAFLTENYAVMSETDDEINFWRQSAVTLLVNDRVQVSSSAVGIDKLKYFVPHNRDLLVVASNGQFKINGDVGITPQTISMALTTKYECQTSVAPVTIGNSVYFPIDYGESTGLQEYTGEKDTGQDFAAPLTNHVIGYMRGKATLLTASPNLEMIAMVTEGADKNQVFIYEQYTDNRGKRISSSWSTWKFSGNARIIDLVFKNDELEVIAHEDGKVFIKHVSMYSRVSTGSEEVYLDDLYVGSTNGDYVDLPEGYEPDGIVCIRGDNLEHELFKTPFTIEGSRLHFPENIGNGKVYIGKQYMSTYRPTRPFRYNEDGNAITTDRLRISRFIISMVDTHQMFMRTISKYYDTEDQEFNSRFINHVDNKIGEIPFYSGDYKFSFAQDAELAEAEFYCNNWLGCTISAISWEGQYNQSKGRM